MSGQRADLYRRGVDIVDAFLLANAPNRKDLAPVQVELDDTINASFGVCAYYRDNVIRIDLKACALIGTAGRQWSYPGYTVDRTPYGVLCHELGHHVDRAHGRSPGVLSPAAYVFADEPAVSSYPDVYSGTMRISEWWAEGFRLFVTNPDLLRLVRPRTYEAIRGTFKPVETRTWDQVIEADRQKLVARRKIEDAQKRRPRRQESLL